MELAARIDALSIELEQRHEELKRHITHTVEHAIVPLLQHVEATAREGLRRAGAPRTLRPTLSRRPRPTPGTTTTSSSRGR